MPAVCFLHDNEPAANSNRELAVPSPIPFVCYSMSRLLNFAMLLSVIVLAFAPVRADTITQTNAQGQTRVIQTDAIAVQNNSYALIYKHFDLKQRRVVEDHLDQGSLPYQVVVSSPTQRAQIVSLWKKFGYTATVITQAGKKMEIYDAYFDFFPAPGGLGAFLETVPARTDLPLLLDNGGADQIEFDQIASLHNQGGHLTATLTNGKVESGKFLMPTQQPAVVHLMGITDQYKPASSRVYDFSMPLLDVKEIDFQNND